MYATRHFARRFAFSQSRRLSHVSPASSPPALKSATSEDLAHFSKILPQTCILSTLPPPSTSSSSSSSTVEDLAPFNNDWMNKYHGKATTVLKPRTTREVSEIVKWCNKRKIGIVPQGGNTGLVGGGVPVQDELVLSLSNMTQIRSFDDVSGMSRHLHGVDLTSVVLLPPHRYLGCRRRLHLTVTD